MLNYASIAAAAAAMLVTFSANAQALECHSSAVTASSRLYLSRSFGAYPGSWAAWRKKVKADLGNGWQAWRRARQPTIECDRVLNDVGQRRWQCTRTAVPCRPGNAGSAAAPEPDPIALCDDYPLITRLLSRGASGGQVMMLQCLLTTHGIKVAIDGDYGRSTHSAVREFQRMHGLTPDGVVGDRTAERLSG